MSTVCVLVAVYAKDDPQLFRESLWSNVLDQTELPDQLVVAVDGPIGEALELVLTRARAAFSARLGADFMTVVRLSRNLGLPSALNAGIARCRCDLIARADADDLSYPERFRLQKKALAESPEVGVVTAWQHDYDVDRCEIVATKVCPEHSDEIAALLQLRNPVCHPSMMIRTDVVRQHGAYSTSVLLLEDYELHLRWVSRGVRYRCLPVPLVRVGVSAALYGRRGGLKYASREFRFRMAAARCGMFKGGPRFYLVTLLYLLFRTVPAGVRRRLYALVRARGRVAASQ
ncbi:MULTISPECIES: glycosyltransferase [unclassified Caballeronia]|uniref:glycosyltransferase n=1 Tax=unclassified Caballeronia TaxID=2646786 RepID=UPI00285B79BD|nr:MULTISPECIES: glycosyltransferase [unclassified Caballeronia]MDR5751970.1 glycosyltransferase [Caballeronia sp. LZ024]MDR5843889.1 glycosyltransferase [Caballeronia sp. LZ031]